MPPEMWAMAAATALLIAAVGGSAAALAGRGRPWLLLSLAARGGSLLALAAALYLAAAAEGGWSPLDLRQMALSLTLVTAVAHLALSWVAGSAAGSPIADALAAVLAASAWLAIRPGGESLSCLQRAITYRGEWALFVTGVGGTLVAGSAALTPLLPWQAARSGSWGLLRAGSFVAVLAIGAGVLAGVWWTWQATGALEAGTMRESWMAVVWLLAAMSAAAWQLEKKARPWAAGLAVAAAGAGLVGLLGLLELQRLMGI